MASNSGMDEKLILVNQAQSVQLGSELSATEENAVWRPVLELLYPREQVPSDMLAILPVESVRVEDTTYLGLVSSLRAHSRISIDASISSRATIGQ